MWTFVHHWIYEDLWVPVWPNWFAGIIGGVVVYIWKGRKWLKRHREHQRKVDEIHAHLGLSKEK